MTLRAWLAACSIFGALTACASDPAAPPAVSTGDPHDASDEHDATTAQPDGAEPEPMPDASDADASASADAGGPLPATPTTFGVHVSVERGPYETASDAFYFESTLPGIQAAFEDATLRVELTGMPGTWSCRDGATVEWKVGDSRLRASGALGSCTVVVEAFGESSGAPISATFHAIVERASGEGADALELHGRIQVAHP